MSNSADKGVDLSGVNPKLRARSNRNKSLKLREAVAYLSLKSQRALMDKDRRKNVKFYESTNN